MSKGWYKGFTLIECLMSLVVLALILTSFSWLLQVESALTANQRQGVDSSLRWHLFVANMENVSRDWQFIRSEKETLLFKEVLSQETLVIEYKQKKIRKRKRGGTELLLENVESVNYTMSDAGVRMDVVFSDKKEYQALFPQWQAK